MSKLNFGKYKGKTVQEIVSLGDISYLVWAHENVDGFSIDEDSYERWKREVELDRITNEAIMESEHGDWGNRD